MKGQVCSQVSHLLSDLKSRPRDQGRRPAPGTNQNLLTPRRVFCPPSCPAPWPSIRGPALSTRLQPAFHHQASPRTRRLCRSGCRPDPARWPSTHFKALCPLQTLPQSSRGQFSHSPTPPALDSQEPCYPSPRVLSLGYRAGQGDRGWHAVIWFWLRQSGITTCSLFSWRRAVWEETKGQEERLEKEEPRGFKGQSREERENEGRARLSPGAAG